MIQTMVTRRYLAETIARLLWVIFKTRFLPFIFQQHLMILHSGPAGTIIIM